MHNKPQLRAWLPDLKWTNIKNLKIPQPPKRQRTVPSGNIRAVWGATPLTSIIKIIISSSRIGVIYFRGGIAVTCWGTLSRGPMRSGMCRRARMAMGSSASAVSEAANLNWIIAKSGHLPRLNWQVPFYQRLRKIILMTQAAAQANLKSKVQLNSQQVLSSSECKAAPHWLRRWIIWSQLTTIYLAKALLALQPSIGRKETKNYLQVLEEIKRTNITSERIVSVFLQIVN